MMKYKSNNSINNNNINNSNNINVLHKIFSETIRSTDKSLENLKYNYVDKPELINSN